MSLKIELTKRLVLSEVKREDIKDKSFYLDLHTKSVREQIKTLEGKVVTNFDGHVDYFVSKKQPDFLKGPTTSLGHSKNSESPDSSGQSCNSKNTTTPIVANSSSKRNPEKQQETGTEDQLESNTVPRRQLPNTCASRYARRTQMSKERLKTPEEIVSEKRIPFVLYQSFQKYLDSVCLTSSRRRKHPTKTTYIAWGDKNYAHQTEFPEFPPDEEGRETFPEIDYDSPSFSCPFVSNWEWQKKKTPKGPKSQIRKTSVERSQKKSAQKSSQKKNSKKSSPKQHTSKYSSKKSVKKSSKTSTKNSPKQRRKESVPKKRSKAQKGEKVNMSGWCEICSQHYDNVCTHRNTGMHKRLCKNLNQDYDQIEAALKEAREIQVKKHSEISELDKSEEDTVEPTESVELENEQTSINLTPPPPPECRESKSLSKQTSSKSTSSKDVPQETHPFKRTSSETQSSGPKPSKTSHPEHTSSIQPSAESIASEVRSPNSASSKTQSPEPTASKSSAPTPLLSKLQCSKSEFSDSMSSEQQPPTSPQCISKPESPKPALPESQPPNFCSKPESLELTPKQKPPKSGYPKLQSPKSESPKPQSSKPTPSESQSSEPSPPKSQYTKLTSSKQPSFESTPSNSHSSKPQSQPPLPEDQLSEPTFSRLSTLNTNSAPSKITPRGGTQPKLVLTPPNSKSSIFGTPTTIPLKSNCAQIKTVIPPHLIANGKFKSAQAVDNSDIPLSAPGRAIMIQRDGCLDVQWVRPRFDGGKGIQNYILHVSGDQDGYKNDILCPNDSNSIFVCRDLGLAEGLSIGNRYKISISANNGSGGPRSKTVEEVFVCSPATPPDASISLEPDSISISITPGIDTTGGDEEATVEARLTSSSGLLARMICKADVEQRADVKFQGLTLSGLTARVICKANVEQPTRIKFQGLASGVTYQLCLISQNIFGAKDISKSIFLPHTPQIPQIAYRPGVHSIMVELTPDLTTTGGDPDTSTEAYLFGAKEELVASKTSKVVNGKQITFSFEDLPYGGQYEGVTLTVTNGVGTVQKETGPICVYEPLSTPQDVAVVQGDGYFDVSWKAPKFDGGKNIDHYNVSLEINGQESNQNYKCDQNCTNYKIEGVECLKVGHTSYVSVSANNGDNGQKSEWKEVTFVRAPVVPPQSVTQNVGFIEVRLTPDITTTGGYKSAILLADLKMADCDDNISHQTQEVIVGQTSTLKFENLERTESQYMLNLKVINDVGTTIEKPLQIFLHEPLSAPRDFKIIRGDKFLTLKWKQPHFTGGKQIRKYIIHKREHKEQKEVDVVLHECYSDQITCTLDHADLGSTWNLCVSADNGASGPKSVWREAVFATLPKPPIPKISFLDNLILVDLHVDLMTTGGEKSVILQTTLAAEFTSTPKSTNESANADKSEEMKTQTTQMWQRTHIRVDLHKKRQLIFYAVPNVESYTVTTAAENGVGKAPVALSRNIRNCPGVSNARNSVANQSGTPPTQPNEKKQRRTQKPKASTSCPARKKCEKDDEPEVDEPQEDEPEEDKPQEDEPQEDEVFEVERVLSKKVVDGEVKYKIRWKGYSADQDSWEFAADSYQGAIDEYHKQDSHKGKPSKRKSRSGTEDSSHPNKSILEQVHSNTVPITTPSKSSLPPNFLSLKAPTSSKSALKSDCSKIRKLSSTKIKSSSASHKLGEALETDEPLKKRFRAATPNPQHNMSPKSTNSSSSKTCDKQLDESMSSSQSPLSCSLHTLPPSRGKAKQIAVENLEVKLNTISCSNPTAELKTNAAGQTVTTASSTIEKAKPKALDKCRTKPSTKSKAKSTTPTKTKAVTLTNQTLSPTKSNAATAKSNVVTPTKPQDNQKSATKVSKRKRVSFGETVSEEKEKPALNVFPLRSILKGVSQPGSAIRVKKTVPAASTPTLSKLAKWKRPPRSSLDSLELLETVAQHKRRKVRSV